MNSPASLLGDPLLRLARELEATGEPYAVATVVSRRPPVSAHVGDKAIVTADGRLVGWIGGSCSQPVVRREALAAIHSGRPRLVRLSTDVPAQAPGDEDATTVVMTCPSGGEVAIYIEPRVAQPQIVAVGDTPLVQALAQMAPVAGFGVVLVSGTSPPAAGPAPAEDGPRRLDLAGLAAARFGPRTFFVVASAGHYDEDALAAALGTPARYIGLVASRRRARAVLEVLRARGVPEAELARIRNPAGLDIGAATQEEIAVSILAEVVAEYRRGLWEEAAGAVRAAEPPQLARDPVCGMDVEVATARHVAEHAGRTLYFCCPHCRHRFLQDPERYLAGEDGPGSA